MAGMDLRAPALALALLAGSAPCVAGEEPKAADAREKDYAFRMGRARELAVAAVAAKDANAAREAYEMFLGAAHLRPKEPDPLAEAGLLALDFGDDASAAAMVEALTKLAPESGPCHYLRGCRLQVLSEFSDARAEFAASKAAGYRVPDCEVRHYQSTVGLGLQYGVANLHEKALKTLGEAVEARPDDRLSAVALYNMAVAHRRLQAHAESEKVLRRCMERFPRYAPAYGELGELLTEHDRIDDAVKVLDAGTKADPSYARGWLLRASAEAERGKFEEAERVLADHDRRFKPTGLSEYHRGLVLRKKGEPAKAIEAFQKAVALDSAMIRSVYWIGLCHRDLGDEGKAAATMERWRKIEEENKRRVDEEVRRALERLAPPPAPAKPGGDGKDGGGG